MSDCSSRFLTCMSGIGTHRNVKRVWRSSVTLASYGAHASQHTAFWRSQCPPRGVGARQSGGWIVTPYQCASEQPPEGTSVLCAAPAPVVIAESANEAVVCSRVITDTHNAAVGDVWRCLAILIEEVEPAFEWNFGWRVELREQRQRPVDRTTGLLSAVDQRHHGARVVARRLLRQSRAGGCLNAEALTMDPACHDTD